ncbi:MAG: DUF3604 domain-containing protein [Bacillota bacterium]|nr:DUF3604 domain-containing protein [Bacillota bacterium]
MTRITDANRAEWLGYAAIEPAAPVIAGSYGTWTIRYVVGKYGVDDGGAIKVAFKLASDWGTPQMQDPSADNYVTVRTSGKAKLLAQYMQRGYLRPYFRTVHIDVYDGSLVKSDEVRVTLGDTFGGSRGAHVQSFVDDDLRFVVAVESFQTGVFYEVAGDTSLRITGGEASNLVAIAPSQAVEGEDTWLMVKAQDMFGNVASGYLGTISLSCPGLLGLPGTYRFTEADQGVHWFKGMSWYKGILPEGVGRGIPPGGTGRHRVVVVDLETRLHTLANPTQVLPRKPGVLPGKAEMLPGKPDGSSRLSVYWGDFHGQTENSVGTGTYKQYFEFARDKSALDFTAHNANDFQVLRQHWEEIKSNTRQFNQPGTFVTFLGTEWSGSTPAGGDHNVYYLDDEAPLHRSSHWQVPDKSDEHLDCYPVDELYRAVRSDGQEAMIIPHVGGRYANLDYHAPDLEPVVEICSAHGRFEWLLQDAIRRGYRVGVVATGDDHTGRPGASYPTRGHFHVHGGLTGVYAEARTREAIWKAIKARRCYATSGDRILLDFRLGEHLMGEEVTITGMPRFTVRVSGTSGIYECELKRGLETAFVLGPESRRRPDRIRVAWGGARLRSRDRHSRWDGGLDIQGGTILGAEGFAFDAPWKGIYHWDQTSVKWRSSTAGDIDGVFIDLDAPDEAVLRFDTPTARFEVTLGEIRRKDVLVDAGLLDQHVSVSTAHLDPDPLDLELSFEDTDPPSGTTPYYVKVLQDDGEMAWSSPIFVTRG